MCFWLLAAVLNGIWIGIFQFALPDTLSLTEYTMGIVICFLLARVMASKAEAATGDKILIPVTGLGLLVWGILLSISDEAVPEVTDSFEAVNSTMDVWLAYVMMALGIMLMAMSYRILRR